MTSKTLAYADCIICKRTFMTWLYGHFINCDVLEHEMCFYDNTKGELHDLQILHPIKGLKCMKCRKSHQLEEYQNA